jgi:hypothetical protein
MEREMEIAKEHSNILKLHVVPKLHNLLGIQEKQSV